MYKKSIFIFLFSFSNTTYSFVNPLTKVWGNFVYSIGSTEAFTQISKKLTPKKNLRSKQNIHSATIAYNGALIGDATALVALWKSTYHLTQNNRRAKAAVLATSVICSSIIHTTGQMIAKVAVKKREFFDKYAI